MSSYRAARPVAAPNAFRPSRVYQGVERALSLNADAPPRPEAASPPERLGELFDLHHARLYRLARRMSHDAEEAHDLVQEAFLRAARRGGALPAGEGPGEAWLVRTLVNLCRDRRRWLRVRARAAEGLPDPEPRTSDPESAAAARAAVQAALARLPARRRAVIVLHELEDTPVAEIARLLGLQRVTVRWHLAAGRRDLRALLLGRGTGG